YDVVPSAPQYEPCICSDETGWISYSIPVGTECVCSDSIFQTVPESELPIIEPTPSIEFIPADPNEEPLIVEPTFVVIESTPESDTTTDEITEPTPEIDTTPPEALLKFNPQTEDIEVTGYDNIDEDVDVSYIGICYERKCTRIYTLTDDAGNKLVLNLDYQKLKNKVKVEISEMTYYKYYSGNLVGMKPNIIPQNEFSANFVKWGLKKQTLWIEDQGIERAVYNHKKDETKLTIETFGNFTNIESPKVTIDSLYQIWLGTDYGKLKACVSPDVYCIFWGLEIEPAL
ncbi:unnamed protein product, partial [marine sediment metagenome]